MQEESKTKAVGLAAKKENVDSVTIKAINSLENEYHFPGVPNWQPMSVRATSTEQAYSIWERQRQPIKAAQPEQSQDPAQPDGPADTGAKVEEKTNELKNEQ